MANLIPAGRLVDADEARELLERATPGPWKVWGMAVASDRSGTGEIDYDEVVATTRDPDRGLRTFNAALIAAAPDLARTVLMQAEQIVDLEQRLAAGVAQAEVARGAGTSIVMALTGDPGAVVEADPYGRSADA